PDREAGGGHRAVPAQEVVQRLFGTLDRRPDRPERVVEVETERARQEIHPAILAPRRRRQGQSGVPGRRVALSGTLAGVFLVFRRFFPVRLFLGFAVLVGQLGGGGGQAGHQAGQQGLGGQFEQRAGHAGGAQRFRPGLACDETQAQAADDDAAGRGGALQFAAQAGPAGLGAQAGLLALGLGGGDGGAGGGQLHAGGSSGGGA